MSDPRTARRTRWLFGILLAAFLILLLNLFRMQVVSFDHYRRLSERNRIRVLYLEGPRGPVVDRKGRPLASNRLSFNCSAIPGEARSSIKESCKILSGVLGESAEELEERFRKPKQGFFNTIILAEDIPRERAIAVEERLDELPGFLIETRPRREYPLGEAAAHLVGYIGPLNSQDLETLDLYEYARADWVGRDGVEKSYEAYLRGLSGGLQIEVNNRGRMARLLGVKEPQEGKRVQLTVDAELQRFVQGLLAEQKGAVAVMDLADGGLLSINSAPSFEPNLFASVRGRRDVGVFLTDPRAPMVDRALRSECPPGSIYKVVTALAALKKRKINGGTSYHCPGWFSLGGTRFGCWKEEGHGPEDLNGALTHSCNVFFYRAGLAAGLDALLSGSTAFGFGLRTGIDLPGERRGFLPSREWKRRRFKEGWFDGETANLSIGQGYLQVTPIQSLSMIAAVAGEGRLRQPHVVDRIQGVSVADTAPRHMDVPKEHWRMVKRGLESVIQSDTGTGRLARSPGVRIAGKTGTAQSGQSKTHAWFVGYAPAEDPKVAMVVFLEHGGRGGVNAASIASKIFGWLEEASYLK